MKPFRSTNVDHLLFRHADAAGGTAAWVFFEVKTDAASCSDPQLEIYRTALDLGMAPLRSDLQQIAAASTGKKKYVKLSRRVDPFPQNPPVELIYLAPCRIETKHPRVTSITFADLKDLSMPEFSEVWELFKTIVLACLRE